MSAPHDLRDVYVGEMRDLWSANNQMAAALRRIAPRAADDEIKAMLDRSVGGIEAHSGTLKRLIAANGGDATPEHCRGMEGLVREAIKHALEEAAAAGGLRDVQILAQYQRMTHYGLAGFGTAAAYARALGLPDQAAELRRAVSEIHAGDGYATRLAEAAERAAA